MKKTNYYITHPVSQILVVIALLLLSLYKMSAQSEMSVKDGDIFIATQIVPAGVTPIQNKLAIWKACNITSDSFDEKTDWVIDARQDDSVYWVEIDYDPSCQMYELYSGGLLIFRTNSFDDLTSMVAEELYYLYTGEKRFKL